MLLVPISARMEEGVLVLKNVIANMDGMGQIALYPFAIILVGKERFASVLTHVVVYQDIQVNSVAKHCAYKHVRMVEHALHLTLVPANLDGLILTARPQYVNKLVETEEIVQARIYAIVQMIGRAKTAGLPYVSKLVKTVASVLLQILVLVLRDGVDTNAKIPSVIRAISNQGASMERKKNHKDGMNTFHVGLNNGATLRIPLNANRRTA